MAAKAKGATNKRRELVDSAIYEAAVQLFYKNGYSNTNLLDIANTLDLSRPALYHYIKSKDEILIRLTEDFTAAKAHELAEAQADTTLSARGKLQRMVASVARQIVEQPLHFRILDRCEPDLPPEVMEKQRDAKRNIRDAFVSVLIEGKKAGEFNCDDVDCAAYTLIGMCTWVAWWFPAAKVADPEETIGEITRMALQAVTIPESPESYKENAVRILNDIRADVDELEASLGAKT